ncbi:MAG: hypothetical protein ACNI3C_02540 [Candidatus Marinarcus sp.]|uniref:hypothetical protein n=1 Tax=Candidatus Marinarcus sp. TaxID=3100987 RepID=UPI003B00E12F
MKRNYWPLLFIAIFTFTLGMIIWTISSAIKVPVNQDESFLNSYQKVEMNFNEISESNQRFLEKYTFEIKMNKQTFGLSFDDIYFSQRVIEDKSTHKDIFNVGENSIDIIIKDKITQAVVPNALITLRVTRATNNKSDINLENFMLVNDSYHSQFELLLKGNWNITGVITVGDNKGYIYFKSNAI